MNFAYFLFFQDSWLLSRKDEEYGQNRKTKQAGRSDLSNPIVGIITTLSLHRAKRWNIVLVETYIKALCGERAVLSLCAGSQQKCCSNVRLVTVHRTNFSVAIKCLGHERYEFRFLHNIWKIWITTKRISCLRLKNYWNRKWNTVFSNWCTQLYKF